MLYSLTMFPTPFKLYTFLPTRNECCEKLLHLDRQKEPQFLNYIEIIARKLSTCSLYANASSHKVFNNNQLQLQYMYLKYIKKAILLCGYTITVFIAFKATLTLHSIKQHKTNPQGKYPAKKYQLQTEIKHAISELY